jgi:hypothetical protein
MQFQYSINSHNFIDGGHEKTYRHTISTLPPELINNEKGPLHDIENTLRKSSFLVGAERAEGVKRVPATAINIMCSVGIPRPCLKDISTTNYFV